MNSTAKYPITKKGYEKIEQEIKHLEHVERPAITQAISDARMFGDLSENAEYHAARERQSFVEGRISDLKDKMARAEVIDIAKLSGNAVTFGATVNLIDDASEEEVMYRIVSDYEADLSKRLKMKFGVIIHHLFLIQYFSLLMEDNYLECNYRK